MWLHATLITYMVTCRTEESEVPAARRFDRAIRRQGALCAQSGIGADFRCFRPEAE
jgi:hypothetical protein